MIKHASSWINHHSLPSATADLQTGQLSPVSTGMEIPPLDVTGPSSSSDISAAFGTSASSVSTWGSVARPDADNNFEKDINWDMMGDEPVQPLKVEPIEEDDFRMEDVSPLPNNLETKTEAIIMSDPSKAPKVKRPRGRPRKHPHPPVISTNKVTKGRSKTGCITCRKRKKKCDEAKPRCMNCEKNAVVCEGYHEKQIWKSGKEKAEEERLRRESLPSMTMLPLFHGIETREDHIFWKHYCDHLSTVLTVEGEAKNAFKDMMVPLATKHKGLMHSILALSGKHIDYETPYGVKLLKDHEGTTNRYKLDTRASYHHNAALGAVYAEESVDDFTTEDLNREEQERVKLNGTYGQMLCFLLQTMADGDGSGTHRIHLTTYQKLIGSDPPTDPNFATFISEFFQYHIYADELLRPPHKSPLALELAPWDPPAQTHPPRLLGVTDGLFAHLPQISRIRETIRHNMAAQSDPVVDYTCLYQAAEIDAAIKSWAPRWPPGDGRDKVSLLYRHTLWIHLYQTINPPTEGSKGTSGVLTPLTMTSQGQISKRQHHNPNSLMMSASINSSPNLPSSFSNMTVHSSIHLPPPISPVHSHSSHVIDDSCSSPRSPDLRPLSSSSSISQASAPAALVGSNPTPAPTPGSIPESSSTSATANNTPYLRPLSHTKSMPISMSSSTSATAPLNRRQSRSPPPVRVSHVDGRLATALSEGLNCLDSFKPSDPCQTLLLIPCLILGTVCFHPSQRERIKNSVRAVKGYTGLRNCDRVLELLARVWERMDAGDHRAAWDWQSLAGEGGDFLCS